MAEARPFDNPGPGLLESSLGLLRNQNAKTPWIDLSAGIVIEARLELKIMHPFAKRAILALVLVVLLAVKSGLAYEEKHQVKVGNHSPGRRIPGLILDASTYPLVKLSPSKRGVQENRYGIVLTGRLSGKPVSLLFENRVVPVNPKGRAFRIEIPLQGPLTEVELATVDSRGTIEKQELHLVVPGWKQQGGKRQEGETRFQLMPGVGISSNRFSSPDGSEFSHIAVTPKVGFSYALKPGTWDLGGNAYYTALLVRSSGPNGATVRYFGGNGRLGYRLPFVRDPWALSLSGGLYYTTMLSTPGEIGYRNLTGPQIYPSFSRALGKGQKLGGYLKYSWLSSGVFSSLLSGRELAGGVHYLFPSSWMGVVTVHFDYADLSFPVDSGQLVENRSLTLGLDILF